VLAVPRAGGAARRRPGRVGLERDGGVCGGGRLMNYAILVDGERVARVKSDDEVRTWISEYREEHTEDDPAAAHVQILQQGAFWFINGGKLIDRERFF